MTITVQPCDKYADPSNCGIAKGLKKKGIFALVGTRSYIGLFLYLIPVCGKIPEESDYIARMSDKKGFIRTKVKVGLYN